MTFNPIQTNKVLLLVSRAIQERAKSLLLSHTNPSTELSTAFDVPLDNSIEVDI